MDKKQTFKLIMAATVILLALLPLVVTFSSVLTGLFNKMGWYMWLQEVMVPFESRLVAVIVKLVGITAKVAPAGQDFSLVLLKGKNEMVPIRLEWNCLGWQSMVLLAATFITGLRGKFANLSKLETIVVGVLGTFLTNLLRMAFIVTLSYYWNSAAAMIIHDYFASLVAIVWMLFFWWFSYRYILEDKESRDANKSIV
jgi:exosortase/archaeosortase family protein